MPTPDTREVILDAAETMLAEHGFAGTSMRRLTAAAGVNLAAVNYHFGSKEELAKAVLARRIAPINAERKRRLDQLDGTRPDVEAVIRAFIEPPLRGAAPGADGDSPGNQLCRVFGRISLEQPPFLRSFLTSQFGELGRRFVDTLAAVLRRQTAATTWWRLHFVVGAMAHTLQNATTLEQVSKGLCCANDIDNLVEELVAFATAGFAAPPPRRAAPKKTKAKPGGKAKTQRKPVRKPLRKAIRKVARR